MPESSSSVRPAQRKSASFLRLLRHVGGATLGLTLTACPGFGDQDPNVLVDGPTCESVQAVLSVRCAGCHGETPRQGAPVSLRLDVFEDTPGADGIYSARNDVLNTILTATMPPPRTVEGVVTAREREVLEGWIAAGANFDDCRQVAVDAGFSDAATDAGTGLDATGRDVTMPDGPPPTLTELHETIFNRTCGSHHLNGRVSPWLANNSGLRGRLLLDSEQLDMPLVDPGNPLNSYLMHKLWGTHRDVGGVGQIMPIGPDLTEEQIDQVAAWIIAGAE